MARRDGKRRIVVGGEPYFWTLVPGDEEGLAVTVWREAGGGHLLANFSHDNLVTPYLVRRAIERAQAAGWNASAPGNFRVPFVAEVAADRPVPAPAALGAEELGFLARIAAAPEDDALRMVYGDWLLERGDATGALVALSAQPMNAAEHARFEALQLQWLGPVAAVAGVLGWHRGMADACRLAKRNTGVVGAAVGHRAWATVRDLDATGSYLAAEDIAALVGHPIALALRTLELRRDAAMALAARWHEGVPCAVEELRILGAMAPPATRVLRALEGVTSVRRLVISADNNAPQMQPLLTQPLVGRLELLTVIDNYEALPMWLAALAAVDHPPRAFALSGFWRRGAVWPTLTFSRDDAGEWSLLGVRWRTPLSQSARLGVLAALAALPVTQLTRYTIDGDADAPEGGVEPLDRAIVDVLRRQWRLSR